MYIYRHIDIQILYRYYIYYIYIYSNPQQDTRSSVKIRDFSASTFKRCRAAVEVWDLASRFLHLKWRYCIFIMYIQTYVYIFIFEKALPHLTKTYRDGCNLPDSHVQCDCVCIYISYVDVDRIPGMTKQTLTRMNFSVKLSKKVLLAVFIVGYYWLIVVIATYTYT